MRNRALSARPSFPRSPRRGVGRPLRLEFLEARLAPAGLPPVLDNVDGNLAALYRLTRPEEDLPALVRSQPGDVVQSADDLRALFLRDGGGSPLVQVWASGR